MVRVERWLHVDINSYFATLLQQENPYLRGRPIGVLKEAGRTCVIAASKEAKKLGITTGCSAGTAQQLAPNIVFLPANFPLCLAATQKLEQIFSSIAPHYELFSLDEAFVDLSDCAQLYPDMAAVGRQVQQQIKSQLGEWVTCNVGLSYNRMLAKLASEIAPKGSVLQITPDNLFYYLAAAPLRDICGIGCRLQKHLRRLNIQSPLALNFISDDDLALWCGPHWAQELRRIGRGEETAFLAQSDHSAQTMKSVSRSITGWQLCRHEAARRRILRNLVDEVVAKSRQMKLAGHHVSVSLEGSGHGQWWFRHQAVPTPVRHSQVMYHIITKLLDESWRQNWPVIRWRVALSALDDWDHAPAMSWLPDWQRQEKIEVARAQVNERFGNFTVFPASLLGGTIIKPEVTGFWGDKNFYRLKGRDEYQQRPN